MFSVRKSSILLALVLVLALAAVATAQGATTVQTATNAKLGPILVDSKGMTLYIYTKDTPNTSVCTGQCLVNWPALTVPAGTTPTGATGISGKFATITRTDNQQLQVTYNGAPLYYYINDKAAGDVTGQNVGTVWFVVNPTTGPVMVAAGTPAATAAATTAATAAPTKAATTAPAAAATAVPTAKATTSAAPGTLPTTGGTADWTLPFLAFIALFLVAGLGFNLVRRAR